MSISTKTGDDGTTGLLFNRRVPKTDAHLEAVGTVDELSAALGLARAAIGPTSLISEEILHIQQELIHLMGEVALLDEDRPRYEQAKGPSTFAASTDRLTSLVHEGERHITLRGWALPGGTPLGAAFDFARTVCRRAERRVLALRDQQPALNPDLTCYLNRLSDLCFIWARLSDAPAAP
jgi:cob(I)alamin adenosyltransferase